MLAHTTPIPFAFLRYSITRRLSRSAAPALVAALLCAVLPALQTQSFPATLAPSVFEPLAAAAVSLAYLRLMQSPRAGNVALLTVALVATAITSEMFVFIACVVSLSSARAVFSSRVDKVSREERLEQVTCVIDVFAVTGMCARLRCTCAPL